jgi:hypothetical protein
MDNIPFLWNDQPLSACEQSLLASVLSMPIYKASLRFAVQERPFSLTLWHHDGLGLRIQSEMYGVTERTEVGVLAFDMVDTPFSDEKIEKSIEMFDGEIEVTKLVITESGKHIGSGVILNGRNNAKIIVLAGVHPYSLAIQGVIDLPHILSLNIHLIVIIALFFRIGKCVPCFLDAMC